MIVMATLAFFIRHYSGMKNLSQQSSTRLSGRRWLSLFPGIQNNSTLVWVFDPGMTAAGMLPSSSQGWFTAFPGTGIRTQAA